MERKKKPEKKINSKNKGGAPLGNKNALGNKGGGVSKYDPKYCDMLLDYFFNAQPSIGVRKTFYANGAIKSEEEYVIAPELPTLQKFATDIGVTYKCLNDWSMKHVEFGEVYTRAREYQNHLVLSNGMAGRYNPALAKLWLENHLELTEKVDVKQNVNASPETIEAFLKAGSGAGM